MSQKNVLTPLCCLIPNDAALNQLLDQLGIERTKAFGGRAIITKKNIEKAGLSFDFFQAFSKLTRVKDNSQNSTAARLLDPSSKILRNKMSELFLLKKISDPDSNASLQKVLDIELDADEAAALKVALQLLGMDEADASVNNNSDRSPNINLLKARLNALGTDSCWLEPESMKIGIFGEVNGKLQHEVAWATIMGLPFMRTTTEANEFACEYLPSMAPLTEGLSFNPDKMPVPIQNAAQSTAILNLAKSRGTGFAALYPGYIITARHVVNETIEKDGKKIIPLDITLGELTISANAEVIDVPGMDIDKTPDLAVLYVPDLPASVSPLEFSNKLIRETEDDLDTNIGGINLSLEQQQKIKEFLIKNPQLLREIIKRGKKELLLSMFQNPNPSTRVQYTSENIYIIGSPHQKPPYDLLVTPGKVNILRAGKVQPGLMSITAPSLPGNSGGPAIDDNGDVAGVVVQLKHDADFTSLHHPKVNSPSSYFDLVEGKITGGEIYPISQWGEILRQTIEEHRALQE